jgi:dihydrodipicolinate synthase/N-acetylneuraminate lyase
VTENAETASCCGSAAGKAIGKTEGCIVCGAELVYRGNAGREKCVFCGSESFLLATMRGGGAGCISATANVNPVAIARLAKEWRQADAEAQQAALDRVRAVFQKLPTIPALKAAIAHFADDEVWTTVRPPLVALTRAQRQQLQEDLASLGFDMPGLARTPASVT